MDEWQHTYDQRDLNYISAKARQIAGTAAVLRVPALGLAGGIAREMTRARKVDPSDPIARIAAPIKEALTSNEPDANLPDGSMTWRPITHQSLADSFVQSNTPGKFMPGEGKIAQIFNKLANPVFWDVGEGKIKTRTAIAMLQNYNRMFPDTDPLDLKRYNDRYDLLLRDLKNRDSDTTVKIAGLVAREGQDFFTGAMTPQRWAALSEDQRAAALTKYYVVGKERMQEDFAKRGGDPNTYMPDFNGDGSDMYFYQRENNAVSNPELLRKALSPDQRSEVAPRDDAVQNLATNAASSTSGRYRSLRATSSSPPATGPTLPPQVQANADYLRANGFAITPRTMYVAHVIGPQRAVDLFRTGSTGSPDVPSADAATGQQIRAWVRALRGVPPAAPASGADTAVSAPPSGPGAFAPGNDAGAGGADGATPWPQWDSVGVPPVTR